MKMAKLLSLKVYLFTSIESAVLTLNIQLESLAKPVQTHINQLLSGNIKIHTVVDMEN